jgi:hypothetical protein
MWKKYSRAGLATDDSTAHVHFTLGTKLYKHTPSVCNTYCFSSTTMVARTRHIVTLQYTACLVRCFRSMSDCVCVTVVVAVVV